MGATHARVAATPPDRAARPSPARAGVLPVRAASAGVARLLVTALAVAVLLASVPAVSTGSGADLRLHVLLDAVDATCAIFGAMMLHARHLRDGRLQDLLLAQALLLAGIAGFGSASETALVVHIPPLATWAVLTVRLVSCLLILAAAFERGRLASRSRSAWRTTGIPALIVAVLGAAAVVLGRLLPGPFDLAGMETVAEGAMLAMLLAASLAFTWDAAHRRDDLPRWLGPAFLLAAAARLVMVIEPSFEVNRFGPVDLLRTGCYALVIAGAVRDMWRYWTDRSRAAVSEDRRRMARELHDGVVQELVLIRLAAAEEPGGGTIVAACDRALDDARTAVLALDDDGDRPLAAALLRTARELEHRMAVRIDTDLDDTVDLRGPAQHELLRIVREAVGNAVRHGDAQHVLLRVTRQGEQRMLSVGDDGVGFDPAAELEHGYGLTSMRDRAASLAGVLELDSGARGTTVMVRW